MIHVRVKNKLKIAKLRPEAQIPQRATEGSVGLDLRACISEPMEIAAGERVVIPTGIGIELPGDSKDIRYCALILARSGLGMRHGICLSNGVGLIDADYRGEIFVGLSNFSCEPYTIEPQERIAQMVIVPTASLPVVETEQLGETARGTKGFGSSGRD